MKKNEKVGAGWKKFTPTGKEYISVMITQTIPAGARLSIFPNGFKEVDKQPDHIVYLYTRDPDLVVAN